MGAWPDVGTGPDGGRSVRPCGYAGRMARYVPAPEPEPVPAAEEAALRQGRARPWWPYLLTAAVSVALLVWTVVAYPGLPEQVPVHWGIDGRPDRWEDTTFGTVAFAPIFGLGMTAFLALIAAMIPAMTGVHGATSAWRRVRQEGVNRGVREGLGWIALLSLLMTAPTTAEVLSAGAWRMPWWLMPLLLTALMVGVFGALRATLGRWTRWADGVAADLGHRPTPEELAEDETWTPLGMKDDPEDPTVFPAKRPGYGVGTTINIGTRAGRLLVYGFVAVFMVALPLATWIGAYLAR